MVKTQALKHFPEAIEGERRGSKGDVSGGATTKRAMNGSSYVLVIEVRGDDSIEYVLFTEVGITF